MCGGSGEQPTTARTLRPGPGASPTRPRLPAARYSTNQVYMLGANPGALGTASSGAMGSTVIWAKITQ
jgi:hypothetical protein